MRDSTEEKPIKRKRRSNSLGSLRDCSSRHNCPKICAVCGRKANGYHYEAPTCCGCKAFFRRIVLAQISYSCDREGSCVITSENRVFCRSCRFEKCVAVGMNPQGIRTSDDLEANSVVQRIAERKSSEASSSRDTPLIFFSSSKSTDVSRLIDSILNFKLENKTVSKRRRFEKRLENVKKTTEFELLKEFVAVNKDRAENDLKESLDFILRLPIFSRLDEKENSDLLDQGINPLFNFHQAFSLFERKDDSNDRSGPLRRMIERSLIDPIERIDMKRKEHVLLKALLLCQTEDSSIWMGVLNSDRIYFVPLSAADEDDWFQFKTSESNGPARFVSLLAVMNTVIGVTALQKDLLFYLKTALPIKEEPIDPDY